LFGILKNKKPFFTEQENRLIIEAIQAAEKNTSGEVRVFVENKCKWVDAIDRAAELFFELKMDKTVQRNAVLVYIAIKDRQLAVFGDEGIHQKLGMEYWNRVVGEMLSLFDRNDYSNGIANCVRQIGEALQTHFPYDGKTDKNELPDEIVFGK
jgi:uncharacterized membrane protein